MPSRGTHLIYWHLNRIISQKEQPPKAQHVVTLKIIAAKKKKKKKKICLGELRLDPSSKGHHLSQEIKGSLDVFLPLYQVSITEKFT